MPIRLKQDKNGPYYQFGNHGTKYYFNPNNERSVTSAHNKALRQNAAIWITKYMKGKKRSI